MIRDVSFFLQGGKAGVLLIHGLTGTPAEMQILGKGLNRAGFTVYGMQLAGHCGTESDLIKTNRHDWYKSVRLAAEEMLRKVDILFVGGLSMGAVLALKLAADYPDKIRAVGVYGATFFYDGWSVPLYARYFGFLLPLFEKLGLFRQRIFIERPPYGVKDERIRKAVADSMFSGDSASAGLAGNPFPALAEMMKLSGIVRRELPKVTVPCLIMHAAEDDIAALKTNAGLVARTVSAPVDLVPLENSYHLITIDRDRKRVIEKSAEFFAALCPPDMVTLPQFQQPQSQEAQLQAVKAEAAAERAEQFGEEKAENL